MNKNKNIIRLFSLIVTFSLVISNLIFIQASVKAEENELVHLVVLADISGSLDTEDTDNLQRLISRIPRFLDNEKLKQSKISVIAFASEAVQVCNTSTISEIEINLNEFNTCLEKIQAFKKNNPNIDKRAENVGIDTNQIKAFEKGLEIISSDPENYVPVFLLLTDGALDPIDTGANSKEAIDEFDRGFEEVRPEMKDQNVQLFIFGFGDAKLEDLTKWGPFGSERRSCQEDEPEKFYFSDDIIQLLVSINVAMNQVTCGESKSIITLEPGEPKEYYVSDLVEKFNIKIDLTGTTGVDAVVTSPSGVTLDSQFEIKDSGECVDDYIVCYEISNPEPGIWSLDSSIYSSEAQTTSIIFADINLYGTFTINTQCEINTLRDGFESCTFNLVPTRQNSSDLTNAIDSVTFDFIIPNIDQQERGTFFQDSLTIQLFRSLQIGSNSGISIQTNPIYSEFNLNDDYKWLQFISTPSPEYVLEPVVTTTTVVTVEETSVEVESNFPWLLFIILLVLILILAYLSSRKKDLPSGTLNYGLKNSSNKSSIVLYGGTTIEYFDVTKTESEIKIEEGDKSSVNLLTLESLERRGIKFWDTSPAQNFQFKFEEQIEKSVDSLEIVIYDNFIVSFLPDETNDEFDIIDDTEDEFEEFKF